MAGEERIDQVTAYLSRLLGEQLLSDQPIQLRSVHRAALGSWARKQNLLLRLAVINSPSPFTVRELLDDSVDSDAVSSPPRSVAQTTLSAPTAPLVVIGIDIEDVENIPLADDYREHPFFQDHFTSAEIAYCLRQIDVRASFCGTWAAKEALLKAGLISSPSGLLKNIEIDRDSMGRPLFPQCSLSISHTPKTAVAVCVATSLLFSSGQAGAQPANAVAATQDGLPAIPKRGRWPWSR
jgi:phosphopantetheine--protein transferase-like protein